MTTAPDPAYEPAGAIVRLRDVRRAFSDGARTREVLRGVDLEIHPGELVALVGPSGGGKTTLLSVMGALDAGFEGEVHLLGQAVKPLDDDRRSRLRNEGVGFVFQAFHLLEHLSVVENVALALWLLPEALSVTEARRRASSALASVGLAGREDERVGWLSGGERQRVAIARAVVNAPRLLLADEPTGNLDGSTKDVILSIFEAVRRREGPGCAVVIATHDPSIAERTDRVVRLVDGQLVAEA